MPEATDPTIIGKPIRMRSGLRSPKSTDEIGTSGLDVQSGMIFEEFLPALKGRKGLRIYREMRDNDEMIGAILFAIEMSMRKATWRFIPADGDDDPEYAEFANECLHDMEYSFDDTLSQILTMLTFGFAPMEIVMKRRAGGSPLDPPNKQSKFDDRKIGWQKWALRAQETIEWWVFSEDTRRLLGAVQKAPPDWREVFIPIEKMALFRPSIWKENPEGRSILRNSYRSWYYKSRMQEIEGIGVERDLAGLPVGWVPYRMMTEQATEDEKAALGEMKKILSSIRRDDQEAVIWPQMFDTDRNKLFDLTLLSTGGRRQFDTDQIVTRYDSRMAMTVLADFVLLGHAKVGSNSTSISKIDLFTTALRAWMDVISGVVDRQVTPLLMKANGMDPKRAPRFIYSNVEQTDLRELGDFISSLAGAGMPLFPDENLENWLRDVSQMPPKAIDDPMAPDSAVPVNQMPGMGPGGVPLSGEGTEGAVRSDARRRNHLRLNPSAFRDGHGDEAVPSPGDPDQPRRPGR